MAAVLQPLQGLSLNGSIMDPSPISPNASRHGRSKHGGSVAKSNKRGRGYSVVDDREALITKALTFVLKRTVEEGHEQEGGEKLVADSEGWVDCEEVLARPNLTALQVTLDELKALIASPKSRFALKTNPESETVDETDASDYLMRLLPSVPQTPTTASAPQLTPLSSTTEDLPDLIVYECSYASYPLILHAGSIKRAGGQAHLQFASIKVEKDGTEVRPTSSADVSIFIDLREIMESEPKISWSRTESGAVVTEGDATGSIVKAYWKKVVARRSDIGVLFENGEVRKEIPIGLRGKGAKAKKGKGQGRVAKEMKARSDEDDTASD